MIKHESWFGRKKKALIAAATGLLLGAGADSVRRSYIDDVEKEPNYSSVELNDKSKAPPSSEIPELATYNETQSLAEMQRQEDLRKTREVRDFISRISDWGSIVDNPNQDITDRHVNIYNYLSERIGSEFMIGDLVIGRNEDGKPVGEFYLSPKMSAAYVEGPIKIVYEADGAVAVQDVGLSDYISFSSDSQLGSNMINQVEKVVRMRNAANQFRSDGNVENYTNILKKDYTPDQIKLILDLRKKSPQEIMDEERNK
ncbi:MAG: hypothetical protein AAB467_01845 [Patescibacteria group bacterium]